MSSRQHDVSEKKKKKYYEDISQQYFMQMDAKLFSCTKILHTLGSNSSNCVNKIFFIISKKKKRKISLNYLIPVCV